MQIPGAVVPGWIAAAVAIALILSALGFLLSIYLVADLRAESVELRREMRLLQLHTVDVENVLIRKGAATREDFAPWPQLIRDDPPPEKEK